MCECVFIVCERSFLCLGVRELVYVLLFVQFRWFVREWKYACVCDVSVYLCL